MADLDTMFPDTQRYRFAVTPLRQVICQLRFPKLLTIEAAAPAEFQERIRDQFPILQEVSNPALAQLPQQLLQSIGMPFGARSYSFSTEKADYVIQLSGDAISLDCSDYTQWEHFSERMMPALAALQDIYRPAFYSRIGVRYINAIDRATLGVRDEPWQELLRSEFLGLLGLPGIAGAAVQAQSILTLNDAQGDGSLSIRHGLGAVEGGVNDAYLIDLDSFTDAKTEVSDAKATLERFSRRGGRVFRWCISPKLHHTMGPSEI